MMNPEATEQSCRGSKRLMGVGLRLLLIGIVSITMTAIVSPSRGAEAAPERLWAVLIGCGKYHRLGRLDMVAEDVKHLSSTLRTWGGVAPERLLALSDTARNQARLPLRANIMSELEAVLKRVGPEDGILVYFSGHGIRDDDGHLYLAPVDTVPDDPAGTAISVEWFRDQIARCPARLKLLILDSCHAGSEKGPDDGQSPAAEDLGQPFEELEKVVTLASCKAKEKSRIWDDKGQSLFSYWLNLGLRGHADMNMDGAIDTDELYRFVHHTVLRTCQVRFPPPVQTPVRIIRAGTEGVPVVFKLRPQPLQSVLADIAQQLVDAAVDHQVERLGVLEFISTLPGEPEVLGGRFGSMGLYCADELERYLDAQAFGKFRLIDGKRLRSQGMNLSSLGSSAELKSVSDRTGGMQALVVSNFQKLQGNTINLRCKLTETIGVDELATVGGLAVLSETDLPRLQGSFVLSPQEDRRPSLDGTPMDQQVVLAAFRRSEGTNPLKDPSSPFAIKILINGKEERKPVEGQNPNELVLPVQKGEEFSIRIQNRNPRENPVVCMRLLVDGLNTLPDKLVHKGIVQEKWGQRVNLDVARAWILDVNDGRTVEINGYPTWDVRGFVKETGAEGKTGLFTFTDVENSLAGRQGFTEGIGLVTAAFYKPDGPARSIGVVAGREIIEDLTPRKGVNPGNLIGVYNLRYVESTAALAGHR